MLGAAIAAFRQLDGGWGQFAAWLLVPDLSMLGYLAGPRVGAFLYNAAHGLLGPALLAGVALALGSTFGVQLALVWVAHVGMDRFFGYGLKYASSFFDTHLGRVGGDASAR